MDNHDSLLKTASQAEKSLKEREASSVEVAKSRQIPQATSISVLVTILLILTGFRFFYIEARDSAIAQDVETSALDLIMEADASVTLFHQQFGVLPEILPDALLRPYVDYSRIDMNNYTLRLHLDGYDEPIPVTTGKTLVAQDVVRVLHLERLN